MESRLFDETIKISSKYNIIPTGLSNSQEEMCNNCDYRIGRLQYDLADEKARISGGSPRIYLGGSWMKSSPACDMEKCLVSTFVLKRIVTTL
jgi:hypothetical protein